MDSYAPLLERTRVPQPSLQKLSVISIFSKLRSAPAHIGSESEPGRNAISQCLNSTSPAVVDQSVRELCRLVLDSKLDLSRGLLELQSALEECDPKFVPLFVKGIGLLVRVGFEKDNGLWRRSSTENHPFVKILVCRTEVDQELVQQVLLFIVHNKRLGMMGVCEFLKPFLNFSILRIPFSDPTSPLFIRQLISSVASICCSFLDDAIPVFKLFMSCLKYLPCKNSDDFRNFYYIVEHLVDAYIVVLGHVVRTGSRPRTAEAQLCGVELVDTVLSVCTSPRKNTGGNESLIGLLKRLLAVQRQLGLHYILELSITTLSLFDILVRSDLEHEVLAVLKLLDFLLKWKDRNEHTISRGASYLSEELLLILPIISLMSSPSKSVKGVASELLAVLERLVVELLHAPKIELSIEGEHQSLSRPGSMVFRLLRQLWFQEKVTPLFLNLAQSDGNCIEEVENRPKAWASQLKECSRYIFGKTKQSQEISLFLGAIAGILVMHPSLGSNGVDVLSAIGIMDPKLGVPLVLAVLFYSNIFTRKDSINKGVQPKLLGVLPSLASHSAMVPLVVQTIMPMLRKDTNPALYASATRLLCQTWEINDRAFGSLQGVLLPKGFTNFASDRRICISMAASIRDVCKANPDRGVDLILSVSACIESTDSAIKALGFQSLAHLCEADVIDFYTAWDVITKHVKNYTVDPVIAHSICLLLRWGAMDAEAYPEASRNVFKILWEIGSLKHVAHILQWTKARVSAFKALTQYDVSYIEENIPKFKNEALELLFSETNPDILGALEGLQNKIIMHEHTNRRRFVKEKKIPVSKIEKLLDVSPQVIFYSGARINPGNLPGAALLCFSSTPKEVKIHGASKVYRDIHEEYSSTLMEIAASLQLSRNIIVVLLSLQSWKAFMRRWMRASILAMDAKAPNIISDKSSKAANDILKSIIHIADDSIPRSAENIALAIGALCTILPASAHTIKSTASKFLLNWLFQFEHEHRQWTSAISLGSITCYLHVTDHKQKFQNISGLLEVLRGSKSTLVKGACGIGLGFACQDLLTRSVSNTDMETYRVQEERLLGVIVTSLSLLLRQLGHTSHDILESLSKRFPVNTDDAKISEWSLENNLDNDAWGVAGLVIGLGSSIGAVYRSGAYDAVLEIKDVLISWSLYAHNSIIEKPGIIFSVGSCLAIPALVAFCQRVELLADSEVDFLLKSYTNIISELLSINKSGAFYKSLLMASCTGAGSFLASILNEGVYSIKLESVKCLLEVLQICYSNPHPPIINFGGMLGVINALGAGAANLVYAHRLPTSLKIGDEQQENSLISGPLLSNPCMSEHLTSLMQEIFLIAQNSDDHQLQQYAAWSVLLLRNYLWSKDLPSLDNSAQADVALSKPASRSVSEDALVTKLGLWLAHLNYSGTGIVSSIATVASVLKCLSRAPRIPTLDWGALIRRCMRYEAQVTKLLPSGAAQMAEGTLREECLRFSLAHASEFEGLLTFLDEISDISRFSKLELNLQSSLLLHLADLMKIFSDSRLEKFFDDIAHYLSSLSSTQVYNVDYKSSLRVSCWRGLYRCLDESSPESLECLLKIEKCIEVLFSFLPAQQSKDQANSVKEWSEAIRCLGKSRSAWLLNFLLVSHSDSWSENVQFSEVVRKVQAKAKLVGVGSIPMVELGRLKTLVFNCKLSGIWDGLVEVVAALQNAEGSVKRQWLVDAIEISCVSNYPSTALVFVGLLSGSCCKYMPLLAADQSTILKDLPVTLISLLSEPNWELIGETFITYLFASMERIYRWVVGDDDTTTQAIDPSENEESQFLLAVMHSVCVEFKDYLPLEKQLSLASMIVS